MTVLDTINFVAFNPLQNNNPIAVRRRKLIAKIDEQTQVAANKDYRPRQHKWVSDEALLVSKKELSFPSLVCVHLSKSISFKYFTSEA